MARSTDWRSELDALRKELDGLRHSAEETAKAAAEEVSTPHWKDLQQLVQGMLDDAEEAMAEHPVVAVAGALALGIVIGRLTAR
jgi:ElaB/YqjD/DUF883 family membrane-anchored ribosome-binding protein